MTKKEDVNPVIPADYKIWLGELKLRIRQSRVKALVKVNEELLALYWNIGSQIVSSQALSNWGTAFIAQLSRDLTLEFPEMKGFSARNLAYCKKFYLFYCQDDTILHQAGAKFGSTIAEQPDFVLFQIPWRHQVEIVSKCSSVTEALFYVHKTIENGWSRAVLIHQIESDLFSRAGKAISNFRNTLPAVQSDLAQQITKDPYIFDFAALTERYNEKELEGALADNITRFLLELGAGFTFYGKQVHLNVNGDDFYIDLLFYHIKLHCYVVVELKTVKFQPEYAGQLNFYIAAVDGQLKSPEDKATIGILICKDKNDVVVEYALQNISSPIGVSSYEISRILSEEYQNSLPTIEELEKELTDPTDR